MVKHSPKGESMSSLYNKHFVALNFAHFFTGQRNLPSGCCMFLNAVVSIAILNSFMYCK